MKAEKTFFVDAPVDKVMDVMRDPALIAKNEKSRDAVSVEVKDLKKTDKEHLFDIQTVNYVRGLTGLDKSKTEKNKIAVRWNLRDAVCQWKWEGGGGHAEKTDITGIDRLVAKGDGTEVILSVSINIGVPFLGRQLSKTVAREFQKAWPKYIELVSQWLRSTHNE
jgi:carbon monoxide dehydrogenase subunit G